MHLLWQIDNFQGKIYMYKFIYFNMIQTRNILNVN